MSEMRTERVEEDVREIKATLAELMPLIHRIDKRLNSELPHLATKAELANLRGDVSGEIANLRSDVSGEIANLRSDVSAEIANLRSDVSGEIGKLRVELEKKPSHAYLWGVMAAMVGTQAVALAAAALVFSFVLAHPLYPQPAAPKAAAVVGLAE
jgi:hypothetical protein